MEQTGVDPERAARRSRRAKRTLRVASLSDRALCRQCLRLLFKELADDIEVVEVAGAREIAALRRKGRRIDAVLFSAVCSGSLELSTLRDLCETLSPVPVIMHTDSDDAALVAGMLDHGVKGVIPTTSGGDIAVAALRLVAAGGIFIPPTVSKGKGARSPAVESRRMLRRGRLERLTRREAKVVELVATGMSNKAIARDLGLAEATVKVHVSKVLRKVEVKNRTELALLVFGARR
ncbi:MAG: response regulator transcription factor [Dongiaceae bacterium]